MPEDDSDYSKRWNMIKNRFTRLYLEHNQDTSHISNSRKKKREKWVWQRRFWEHLIRDEDDFVKHLDYIHYNPVKHGYVDNPIDWEWSSLKKYVKMGWYDEGWGRSEPASILAECVGE